MKKLIIFLVSILCIESHSQISFEKGYFIKNSNEKVNCLIKNIDWKNNPTELKFKLNENSIENSVTIKSIKEFYISNLSKYIRRTVEVDTSNNNLIAQMSRNRAPLLKEKELLLKVLVEGRASLYFYEKGNLKKYFFKIDSSKIQPLIHKKYLNPDNEILENNRYRQQLFNNLKCKSLDVDKISTMEYKNSDLVTFFEKYNTCISSKTVNYEKGNKRNSFDITLRLGVSNPSLIVNEYSSTLFANDTEVYDLGRNLSLNYGAKFEYILPFNKNKWSLFAEPVYRSFKSKKNRVLFPNSVFEKEGYIDVKYSSLELFFGLNYYMFLKDDLSLFLSSSYVKDIVGKKSLIDLESGEKLEINSDSNMAFGLGGKYKNKYSLEFRFQTKRDLLKTYRYWTSSYNSYSMVFGYTFF